MCGIEVEMTRITNGRNLEYFRNLGQRIIEEGDRWQYTRYFYWKLHCLLFCVTKYCNCSFHFLLQMHHVFNRQSTFHQSVLLTMQLFFFSRQKIKTIHQQMLVMLEFLLKSMMPNQLGFLVAATIQPQKFYRILACLFLMETWYFYTSTLMWINLRLNMKTSNQPKLNPRNANTSSQVDESLIKLFL